SYGVYKAFLRYLYTGEVCVAPEAGIELLDLAESYCETDLKSKCVRLIRTGISVENVLTIYSAVLKYEIPELEDLCFTYALTHLTQLTQTKAFKDMDPIIFKDFIIKASKKDTGDCICKDGYQMDTINGDTCVQTSKTYHKVCTTEYSCNGAEVCFNSRCECLLNYRHNQTLGACQHFECQTDTDCQTPYLPVGKCLSNVCVCPDGYSYYERNCYLKSKTYGKSCSSKSDCSGTTERDERCVDSRCECQVDRYYHLDKYRCEAYNCSTGTILGCGRESDSFRHCSNGRCVCDDNYDEDRDNGNKCTRNWTLVYILVPVCLVGGPLIGTALVCLVGARRHIRKEEVEKEFKSFKDKFTVKYDTAEEHAKRLAIFEENYRGIVAHNEGADQGLNSHRLRVNPFADLTNEEFNAQMKGYRPPARKMGAGMQTVFSEEVLGGAAPTQLPATVNWTAQGLVTPVKYQGQ
ncbi:unnamed protein product, partial [Oppiella nova]